MCPSLEFTSTRLTQNRTAEPQVVPDYSILNVSRQRWPPNAQCVFTFFTYPHLLTTISNECWCTSASSASGAGQMSWQGTSALKGYLKLSVLTCPNLPAKKHAPPLQGFIWAPPTRCLPTGVRKGTQKDLMRIKPFPKAKECLHSDFDALILN